jgi:hypothetical protein
MIAGKKDLSCFALIRGNHEPFNRLTLNFTFYIAHPSCSIETRSLPTLIRAYPRRNFTLITRTARRLRQLP